MHFEDCHHSFESKTRYYWVHFSIADVDGAKMVAGRVDTKPGEAKPCLGGTD